MRAPEAHAGRKSHRAKCAEGQALVQLELMVATILDDRKHPVIGLIRGRFQGRQGEFQAVSGRGLRRDSRRGGQSRQLHGQGGGHGQGRHES